MAVKTNCPSCGKLLQVRDDAAGKRLKCPGCQHVFSLPPIAPSEEPKPVPDTGQVAAPEDKPRSRSRLVPALIGVCLVLVIGALVAGFILLSRGSDSQLAKGIAEDEYEKSDPGEEGMSAASQEMVLSWQEETRYGQFPSSEDIRLLKESLPGSLQALRVGIQHQDENVRMCTAYALGKLGPLVAPLAIDLRHAIEKEQVRLVRVYQASAFAALGVSNGEMLSFLRNSFHKETDEQAKTSLAGSLVSLSSIDDEAEAWQWFKESLEAFPPQPPAERPGKTVFWDRRRAAIDMVQYLGDERKLLVEALDRLEQNPSTPKWIKKPIPETLADIEGQTKR